jgi:probable HAF family extracellular repeat protein
LGILTDAADINDSGQVVGFDDTAGPGMRHALLYDDGVITDLGHLGGGDAFPRGVNERGDVIGISKRTDNTLGAFIWSDGAMRDLNALLVDGDGWDITSVQSINNVGEIVGLATFEGEQRAVLLQPVGR